MPGRLCGQLADRPKRIKVEIFPYEDVDVDGLLSQLQSAGFISRYTVGDVKVIQVLTFLKHQRITGSEATAVSQLPPQPEENLEATVITVEQERDVVAAKEGSHTSVSPFNTTGKKDRKNAPDKTARIFSVGGTIGRVVGLQATPP